MRKSETGVRAGGRSELVALLACADTTGRIGAGEAENPVLARLLPSGICSTRK